MTTPADPARIAEPVSPQTAEALAVVMAREGVDRAEALRRLVGYGELVFRTARLEGGEVLLRRGKDVDQVVLLDAQGDPLVRGMAPLVWMRPTRSTVACGFPKAEVDAQLDPLEPIAHCDRWSAGDLVPDDSAERCPACVRAANRWVALGSGQ